MPNVVIKCTRECRLINPGTGLEEHYEDEVTGDLYEVTEERAQELIRTGNFAVPPPGSVPQTSYVPPNMVETTAAPAVPVPEVFTFPPAPETEEKDTSPDA